MAPVVALLMGSESDRERVRPAAETLEKMGVEVLWEVISAHRQPDRLRDFVREEAPSRGVEAFIAAAGMAAHLPGVVASLTTLPVIGLPLSSEGLGGLDALLSVVQMPRGVPVAAVGIDNAVNAALLACSILALKHGEVADAWRAYRVELAGG
ncbi:5-(carboxyamino)imidazole ribonucleotide mutase [Candidatus Solincola tengchongensis]|uniref:5-(carboxyamino)imidazole ribonucleotide mutase n=1 Tax=Candidatus Solincola tengchongensis TaxID=2900693 RepID=UPI002580A2E8|nr:5-(carboxyamino)imidazole ribonucleotide mutase [Candidatus Solincola tengchongensis]